MANVTLWGASYSDVPAITVPQTGGGTARFTDVTDTTATASDVASGKYFYTAAGIRTTGTNSGGGGGASNFVTGTFTTDSSAGADSVTIPYTGDGYPIACIVVVEDGAYNSSISEWYTSVQRYAVGQWTMTKANMTTAPTYTTSGAANQGVTAWIYKNSTSSSTSYSRSSAMNTNVFSSSNASNAGATCIRFKSATTLSVYTNTSSYGLLPNLEYRYFVVYSE